ncbi:MAG: rRNA maturation RNase YbeY [Caldilineaceae bacterium]|nr:rRNA maturation RNase YbeY [Caldilineaceae bacterium]
MTDNRYEIALQIDEQFVPLVDEAALIPAIEATLAWAGLDAAELSLVLTDDAAQQRLNRTYRGVDAPTDVLSFSAREQGNGEADHTALPPELAAELASNLGDIVIALPYAQRQAVRFDNSLMAELRLLSVHGVLHLLGYDHATPADEARMWRIQNEILAAWGDPDTSQRVYPD